MFSIPRRRHRRRRRRSGDALFGLNIEKGEMEPTPGVRENSFGARQRVNLRITPESRRGDAMRFRVDFSRRCVRAGRK